MSVEGIALRMSALLTDLIEVGDKNQDEIESLRVFNSPKVPSISLYDYLMRIQK